MDGWDGVCKFRLILGKVVRLGWGFETRARIWAGIPLIYQVANFPQLPSASSLLKPKADLRLDQTKLSHYLYRQQTAMSTARTKKILINVT